MAESSKQQQQQQTPHQQQRGNDTGMNQAKQALSTLPSASPVQSRWKAGDSALARVWGDMCELELESKRLKF
jgi:uncharacterized membrane protein YkoI